MTTDIVDAVIAHVWAALHHVTVRFLLSSKQRSPLAASNSKSYVVYVPVQVSVASTHRLCFQIMGTDTESSSKLRLQPVYFTSNQARDRLPQKVSRTNGLPPTMTQRTSSRLQRHTRTSKLPKPTHPE